MIICTLRTWVEKLQEAKSTYNKDELEQISEKPLSMRGIQKSIKRAVSRAEQDANTAANEIEGATKTVREREIVCVRESAF